MINKRMFTTLLLVAASLQVACGGKSKNEKIKEAFTELCGTGPASKPCVDMYTRSANAVSIAGLPATSGIPQIATPGLPLQAGQVPETTMLPASVLDAKIKSQSAQISSALQAIEASAPKAAAPAAAAATMSTASAPVNVSIDVARVPSSEPAMNQATYAPAAAPVFDNGASVAAGNEVSSVGAGR